MEDENASAPAPQVIWSDQEQSGIAKYLVQPAMNAAWVIKTARSWMPVSNFPFLVSELKSQAAAASSGDLAGPEALLIAQAHTLDILFSKLCEDSLATLKEHPEHAATLMRLALKAQNQSRANLETLGHLRNPGSVSFVRQANIAHGPQQVNNVGAVVTERHGAHAPLQGSEILPQNELLEVTDGTQVVASPARVTEAAYSTMETVGEVNRPTHGRRKGALRPKRD